MLKLKRVNQLLLICFIGILFLINSCKNPCKDIVCFNNGVCLEGSCDCVNGFLGENCDSLSHTKIQMLLNEGQTPKALFDKGIPLKSLYGKTFQGGLIFHLNIEDGSGLLAAITNQNIAGWGCNGYNITLLNDVDCTSTNNCEEPLFEETEIGARIGDGKDNTDAILAECNSDYELAARLCRNLGDEWFLPSRGELNLMFLNLQQNGYGDFFRNYYWSSTEHNSNDAWIQNFIIGLQYAHHKNPYGPIQVRAAKAF